MVALLTSRCRPQSCHSDTSHQFFSRLYMFLLSNIIYHRGICSAQMVPISQSAHRLMVSGPGIAILIYAFPKCTICCLPYAYLVFSQPKYKTLNVKFVIKRYVNTAMFRFFFFFFFFLFWEWGGGISYDTGLIEIWFKYHLVTFISVHKVEIFNIIELRGESHQRPSAYI